MRLGILTFTLSHIRRWSSVRLAAFASATQGAVAVEFGLIAMPFFLLLLGILFVGFMLFCSSSLDFATQKAARQIMVGTVQSGNLSASQFRTTVVCPLLPSPMFDCTKVVVNLTTIAASAEPTAYYDFVNPDNSGLIVPPLDNTKTSFCPGTGGGFQVLQVLYPLPVYLSLFSSSSHVVNNQFILVSSATFKNEPFQGGSSAPAGC